MGGVLAARPGGGSWGGGGGSAGGGGGGGGVRNPWRCWRHGPRTAILQNSGGGGGSWGVSHTRTGPGRPPPRRPCGVFRCRRAHIPRPSDSRGRPSSR